MESETNTTTSIKREMLPNNYTSLQLVGYDIWFYIGSINAILLSYGWKL